MRTKKMAAAAICAVMALGTATASAEWRSAGYDTTDLDNIGKIYNEVIGGKYTSKTKIDPLADEDIVWRAEGYELEYPHAGYDRLYLEGNKQQITRYNNLFPQWETRFSDYFWELYGEHRIYQRQQTNIPGLGWRWDYSDIKSVDDTLFVPTTRNAVVTTDFKIYGVGPYDLDGNYVTPEVAAMYSRFGVDNEIFHVVPGTKEISENTFFHNENLSRVDENGQYIVSDEEIADNAGSILSKLLTGPSLRGDSPTKDVAAEYLEHGDVWQWDDDTLKYGGGNVSWTGVMYESKEPYLLYQYLIINGVVFDGHNDLPRIYRYTGGKATPNVEWKYAFAEGDPEHTVPDMVLKENYLDINGDTGHLFTQETHKHSIVEFKYLDGKLACDDEGRPIWRYSGEFENCYITTTDTQILVWITGVDTPVQVIERANHDSGYYAGYMGGANFVAN